MRAIRHLVPTAALLAVLAAASSAAAAAEPYRTALASRVGHDGPAADAAVLSPPAASADGATIAFSTTAGNFPGSSGSGARVVVKSLDSGETVIASRADGRDGAPLAGGSPALSANGRYVCWLSLLVPELGSPASGRLVVRDLAESRTYLVPGSSTDSAQPLSTAPCAVSDDGKVAYVTTDRHAPEDGDAQPDVYLYDVGANAFELVSVDGEPDVGPGPMGPAAHPDITPDGRHVSFTAYAYPPSPPRSPARNAAPASNVFVRDVAEKELHLVSRPDGCDAKPPALSHHDASGSRWSSISDDGRLVAFQSGFRLDDDAPAAPSALESESAFLPVQTFLREIDRCETHLVSRASGPDGKPSDDESVYPSISGDGRYVAFTSFADNLDPDVADSRNRCDVFVRDWRAGRTALVSRATGLFGVPANARSGYAAVSRRGARIVFASQADNLTETPTGNVQVYARDTIGPRRTLAADLPGKPRARASYRGGRSGGGQLVVHLSEASRLMLTVERLGPRGRRIARALPGEEGRNRIPLRRRLRAGRYRISIAARDFAHDESLTTAFIEIRRR